jgi:alkylhydroperoxidase/carboxymuconolactone decarboxylase family protein YurZ
MHETPKPPQTYEAFVQRFPKLAQAWDLLGEAGQEGPLDEKTVRLLKLAVAAGALREGAVRANVRKALAAGLSRAEIEQVIALAASTVGLPSAVAIYSWLEDVIGTSEKPDRKS